MCIYSPFSTCCNVANAVKHAFEFKTLLLTSTFIIVAIELYVVRYMFDPLRGSLLFPHSLLLTLQTHSFSLDLYGLYGQLPLVFLSVPSVVLCVALCLASQQFCKTKHTTIDEWCERRKKTNNLI